MSKHFSLKRFLLLIKKQGLENLKLYLLCAAALAFILSFVFIFYGITSGTYYDEEAIYITYIVGLIISGAIFGSFSFQSLSSKDKATYYLSFPASRSEKLAVVLFYNIIVFTIAYTLIFFIIKSIFWSYLESLAVKYPQKYHLVYLERKSQGGFMEVFPYFFYLYFAVQAFYILGSVYFNRFAFIKTTIVGSLLIFLFVWYFAQLIAPGMNGIDPSGEIRVFGENGMITIYQLPKILMDLLKYSIQMIWAPVFLVATYFRLREKQV